MPDEAREVVYPHGLPVTMFDRRSGKPPDVVTIKRAATQPDTEAPDAAATKAEGGLSREAGVVKKQTRHINPLSDGDNLMRVETASAPPP